MAEGRRYIRLFVVGAAVLITALQGAAQVTANATFDPARVETGDTFSLRVLVSGLRSAPKHVDFSAWKPQLPEKNILNKSAWSPSGAKWVQRFTLIAFDSATLELPPLTVHLHLGDTVQTNALQLDIVPTPAPAETRDMDAIRDIRREPTLWMDYWPWAAGLAAALVLLIWYTGRRRKRPKTVVAAAPPAPPPGPTPRELALQKLAALEQQKPWQKGQLLPYYAELSMIVREYLEHRYGILALESTTREIAVLLKNTDFPDDQKAPLHYLLQQADLIKYADIAPPNNYHEKALESARQVIHQS